MDAILPVWDPDVRVPSPPRGCGVRTRVTPLWSSALGDPQQGVQTGTPHTPNTMATNSFNRWAAGYAERAKAATADALKAFSDPDSQRWVLFAIVIPAALFVLLSPGLIANLPPNTKGRCAKQVPFPSNATGHCSGKVYVAGTSDALTPTQMSKVCEARDECASVWASGYTSAGPVFLHAGVFVLVAFLLNMLLRRAGIKPPCDA